MHRDEQSRHGIAVTDQREVYKGQHQDGAKRVRLDGQSPKFTEDLHSVSQNRVNLMAMRRFRPVPAGALS